jgi:dephospho-CoA kinase
MCIYTDSQKTEKIMKVIGLCGGSGSGKSSVSRLFAKYNIPSIDTDQVYREITSYDSECMRALVDAFGESVKNTDGSLNRERMREIVFFASDSNQKRMILNEITHKFVLAETESRIDTYAREGKKAVIADVPLMFESGFDMRCDILIAVIAADDIRVSRIIQRDGISEEQAKARIAVQLSADELLARVKYVIENNLDIEHLERQVDRLYKKIFEN